ncbi:hypothetical protein HN51_007748 [Arachis hypogaea]|uniref:Late embryogenesis abundant protein At1g64065-like n=1 Tax=Arachis duranensis TaxID=130453 RepID=A0A6P4DDJ4_ARADU|nr:late embryogenesis abundant protein At1g64065-like [Arachis duranensis]XP_025702781.1 late embryogenesis abundant protein At1g64065-like [Arachis hypogaea]QHO41944.1 Late embryogenesis abundant protein [Arachis hypogaea]
MAQKDVHHQKNKHSRIDQETALYYKAGATHQQRSSSKCFVFVLAAFVFFCATLLVFASIVRFRNPQVKLTSATLIQIRYNNPTSSLPSLFNATLLTHLTITNPNYGGFSYENGEVSVVYGGLRIGDIARVRSDTVKARKSKEMNVTMKVRSPNNVTLLSGNHSGTLNLTSYARFNGTVRLLKIIKKRNTIEMACVINLNFTSHQIKAIHC